MKTVYKLLFYILLVLLFVILTVLTQIGGIILVITLLLSKTIKYKLPFKTLLVFIILYSTATFLLVPKIAKISGREKVIQSSSIKPANYISVILNRNYVLPEVNKLLRSAAYELKYQNSSIQIRYLDACFPFINGFPLLPHLSHNDGKKIDLSLVYENQDGIIINKSKSISGYGVFENALNNEFNQTQRCFEQGYLQYDFPKYLTLGRINSNLKFSEKGTKQLLLALLKEKTISKIFIEPHLKNRMGIKDTRVRFQGCRSVRHDDHIHIQIN
ncbi:hypothetical protein [Plebeiibacterium sediminum]|uniref:Uncharacterized protein n=1 Tax=Plebeiibacterium sediminum TaxID=2992112 RepID=A0AAE3M6B6_9BACT|nr:hypothetical protein [Plebeiobacterium sediminum]MCW3787752.1 hypothetical protein [Plebeiobacterium sediminum]